MTVGQPGDAVRITRMVDAPRENVFRAWTEPDEIRKWWGGTYMEVDPPSRLRYTWRRETGPAADGSESLVTVEFNERGGQTELVLTHTDFPPSHGPAPYEMGWEGGLDKFERLLAGSGVDA